MRQSTVTKRVVNADAVITRANGNVENWGRLAHKSWLQKQLYTLKHPVLIFVKRPYWRFRQWRRQSLIQA